MKEKIIFQKNYTRDTSLFLQDIWARDQAFKLPTLLGKNNPYLPAIVHYVNNGTVEIWEHEKATSWLLDTLLEKNISDPSFFKKYIEEYKKDLEEIKVLWKGGPLSTKEQLKSLARLIEKCMVSWNIYYRTQWDNRSPKDLRDVALEIRNEDAFFSQNDILVLSSIAKIFPEFKGYESYIFSSEIDNLPSLDVLKKRKEHFIVIDGSQNYLSSLPEFIKENPEYFFEMEKIEENIKELKGQIGFKGIAKGPVKVLFRREQIHEVKEGDILVSPMTTPDFLAAMQKAAAFVTDEGGITCHAAIVAREMKKPCIIGTKIATKVLKDGDLVEVDAEKGIIKILN